MSVVQITKRAPDNSESCPFRRALLFSLADKFFLIGALAGLFSGIALGAYVWLMRSGIVPMHSTYQSMRSLHSFVQFYLFLTPFILGFLIQSAPKLFESRTPLLPLIRKAIPAVIISALAKCFFPESPLPSIALALSLWSAAASLLPQLLNAERQIQLRFGIFVLISLISLGFGSFIDLGAPEKSLILFWFGIISIIFGTGQQFIAGALQGSRPSSRQSLTTLLLFLAAGLALYFRRDSTGDILAAGLAVLTILSFLRSTGARVLLSKASDPLGFAFISAHFWALVGAVTLIGGPSRADAVLHLWGLGFAASLIIAISLRITAWITNVTLLSERLTLGLLLLWQLAPFTRGLEKILSLPESLILVGAGASATVLILWVAVISFSVLAVLIKQIRAIRA